VKGKRTFWNGLFEKYSMEQQIPAFLTAPLIASPWQGYEIRSGIFKKPVHALFP
jgi:hypothetical protein